jgi:hypothetical protein
MRPFLGVQVYGASAFSKNKDAALDFISFATCTTSAVELYKGFIKVPVRKSVLESDATVKANPNIAIWNAQAADGVPMPNIPAMSNVWKPWGDAMDAIIPGNAPDDQVQSLLDNAVAQIKTASRADQVGSLRIMCALWRSAATRGKLTRLAGTACASHALIFPAHDRASAPQACVDRSVHLWRIPTNEGSTMAVRRLLFRPPGAPRRPRQTDKSAYLYLAPVLVATLLFIIMPFLYTVYISFTNY